MIAVGAAGVDRLESTAGLFHSGEGDAILSRHVECIVAGGGDAIATAAAAVVTGEVIGDLVQYEDVGHGWGLGCCGGKKM